MENIKGFLLFISALAIFGLFMGSVSAASLNLTDAELASSGVKNYTVNNGHVPGYVDVSNKNITTPSFLNTVTTYTVELNKNVKTSVTLKSVAKPKSPSGTAKGTLKKSEYVKIANNIKNYITKNKVAPAYASSSLGKIRYESLVYIYSKIIDYYHAHNVLPNTVLVSNIKGVDSKGVIIPTHTSTQDLTVTDVIAPTTGVKGATIIVPNTVKNLGNTATGGLWVTYYLVSGTTNAFTYIGERYINSLAAGAINQQNTQLTIPNTILSDNYLIVVSADSTGIIKESNENNNVMYSPAKINIIDASNYRPVYITSDNINNTVLDNARINNIVTALQQLGLFAVNYGVGPNEHYSILENITIPQNALIVDIYGGFCAGTIWEMNQTYYKYYKGSRSVFSIWIDTAVTLDDIQFLPRAHDDDFTPLYGTAHGFPNFNDIDNDGIFDPGAGYTNGIIYPTQLLEKDGLNNPALFLINNGYQYLSLLNEDINTIVDSIFQEATNL
ncbi:MAG TPA: pseudomurein-binding repeat-containing protein [Methanobacterium sp.]